MTLSRRTSVTQWRRLSRESFPSDWRPSESYCDSVMGIDQNDSSHRSRVSWHPNFVPFSINDSQVQRVTQKILPNSLRTIADTGTQLVRTIRSKEFRISSSCRTIDRTATWLLKSITSRHTFEARRRIPTQDLIEVQITCMISFFWWYVNIKKYKFKMMYSLYICSWNKIIDICLFAVSQTMSQCRSFPFYIINEI